MVFASSNTSLVSCCNSSPYPAAGKLINHHHTLSLRRRALSLPQTLTNPHYSYSTSLVSLIPSFNYSNLIFSSISNHKTPLLRICHCSLETQNVQDQVEEEEQQEEEASSFLDDDGQERDWTTSILLFVFWGGLIYYVSFIAPNQTPSTDTYLLQKLLNLKGDDGFRLNQVLVALWYVMGLWPLIYSMLLLPTGRSSKNRIPVWPFLVLSCFGGAYALIPYFVLWTPPPPPIQEKEVKGWPLNFLESKVTAALILVSGLGLMIYAGSSGEDVWKEFFQYFRGSKFIHLTGIDFSLLSAFAPFWVYNDMTARKWHHKGFWLLPISVFPFLGPALYLLLRPSLLPTKPSNTEEGK